MPRGRPVTPVVLNDDEKSQLLSLVPGGEPHGLVQRAQIVLACAQGDAELLHRLAHDLNNVHRREVAQTLCPIRP